MNLSIAHTEALAVSAARLTPDGKARVTADAKKLTEAKGADIPSLFAQWLDARAIASSAHEFDPAADAALSRYQHLQAQILTRPASCARDLAIQFVVDTDHGESAVSRHLAERFVAIAMEVNR